MEELIQVIVKSYGIVGILFMAPMVAVVYLWRHNNKLQGEVVLATQAATRAQEQRVTDAQSTSHKLLEVLSEQSALNKETNIALDQVRELLMYLSKSNRK
jgi:hypothetical protein